VPGPARFVRINGLTTSEAYEDIRAVAQPGLAGIMLPKAESGDDIRLADWLLTQLERERGLGQGSITILPIVETATGISEVAAIAAASPRVRILSFGAGDLSLDLGISPSALEVMLWAKIQLVIASRAAGLEPPIDTVFTDLRDHESLQSQAAQARRIGFQGKACIHPDQVPIVNQVFTPSADEVQQAQRVVDAFEAATRDGSAAIVVEGVFVDYPVAERARRLLVQAQRPPDTAS
jgi:citrate lyase subunit beta/citryl-CoA lyase